MPLLLSKPINEVSRYAIWNIQETNEELIKIHGEEIPQDFHPTKLAEWLVARILVKTLCAQFEIDYEGVLSEKTGKPYLKNREAEISISHSFPMAAAMIHLKSPCGIDLELPRHKLIKVSNKFINGSEVQYTDDLQKLCAIWCAKEVLYKIHSRRKLSLKDDTSIRFLTDELVEGSIHYNGTPQNFNISVEEVKNYVLAYSNGE